MRVREREKDNTKKVNWSKKQVQQLFMGLFEPYFFTKNVPRNFSQVVKSEPYRKPKTKVFRYQI